MTSAPDPAADGLAALVADRLLAAAPRCGRVRVLALDGGAASGKSTLARAVAEHLRGQELSVALVQTDFLLDGWDDQYGWWERLRTGVLEPLAVGRPGAYRRYDWHAGRFAGTVAVPCADVLIVEGVSSIPACADRAAVRVHLDVPRAERERRWVARDHAPMQPEWVRWLDREDAFTARHPATADLRLGPAQAARDRPGTG